MSLAPERLSIGLRRLFTSPGVDPFDEVVWERRDARISNWKDGTVAFEQLDVEFPVSWSMNATNIVAQKYFRGTLGTPGRESSLRQVVDRVVGTISTWGREGGYFVDADEEAAFAAELRYILVTQRAAFNSPVWFNIGVPGVPQQASACQPYDALVSTPGGLVPIGELVARDAVGTKVYDATGLTSIVATKANGRKPVLRLHTRAGYTLDVTPDHLVWRASGMGTGRFVPAGELRPGDQLTWHRTEAWGDGEITSREISEAALAGWLQGDGFVGQYDHGTNRSLTVELMTMTETEHAWVLGHLDVVFPDVHRKVRPIQLQDPSLVGRRIRLYGEVLRPFVERWGLLARGSAMTVPGRLFTAPEPVVAAYLRSIFQAEASVSVRQRAAVVALDMVGEMHVRGIQQLLTRFGVFARVRRTEDVRPDRQGTWSLTVRPLPERDRLAALLPFIDAAKQDRLERSLELGGIRATDSKRLEIERIEQLGEMEVYDIQTESGEYVSAGGLRVHNCFILSVDDTMDSILNWYREEGIIFKGGSGSGINLSKIRSSAELLNGGGTASGPVSFMRGADASAGTIKSGGKTRRAAKMVVLNADHPDVEEFIWCKVKEERKARVLRDNGFDMDLDGADSFSIQYQNANNSVRITDEFMQAVAEDADWGLVAVTTGEVLRTVKARDLWRQIAQAAWDCADPGLQFDTTINRWHTAHTTGRINASNPCFTGDTLVHTDKGLIRFRELFDRANHGEEFQVWTHDLTNPDEPRSEMVLTTPDAFMLTGRNPILRLRFSNGMELRCTPGHKIFTTNRGYVEASELTAEDDVCSLDLPAPAVNAEWAIPVTPDPDAYRGKGEGDHEWRLPEVWSEELGHYLGWLIGDGSTSGPTTATIYGSAEDREEVLPRHQELVEWINGDRPIKVSEQSNGTAQLRLAKRAFKRWLEALGVASVTGEHKQVPWSIEQAPPEIVGSFLRGLYDADGCAVMNRVGGSYVGLVSISPELLRGVQRLLSTMGISSRIYAANRAGQSTFSYGRKDGTRVSYQRRASYDLRITGSSVTRFAAEIGFGLQRKAAALRTIVAARTGTEFATRTAIHLVEKIDEGSELTYNLSEPRNHSYVTNGLVVRNCSEYVHLDNSACNLASINLLTFLDEDGGFDVDAFRHTVETVFTAQEILVGRADYPTQQIAETSRDFRQLGLGYANLGAMLMALGLAYDSPEGRTWAAAITSLMTGHAYATSARTASRMGPFAGFADNEEHMLRVLRMHRDASYAIDGGDAVPAELLAAGQEAWEAAVRDGEEHGVRNSQATVLAPTGCLVGGSLITTDRGLVRLRSLGDPDGEQWQDTSLEVLTDEGVQAATKFYVNGLERVVDVRTERGYAISGTVKHRIKVVGDNGQWVWRRFSDLRPGDRVPLALGQLVGSPNEVVLPPLSEKMAWAGEHHLTVPTTMSAELAELVGYFMGDGSLHARGLRLCVTDGDFDVIERIEQLTKGLFGIQAATSRQQGYVSVELHSVRLAEWWQACGFAKRRPVEGHAGKGYVPHVPDAVLHTNDRDVYRAFVRGLFEADGTVTAGYPSWTTAKAAFADEVQTLLLALGFVTTRTAQTSARGSALSVVRLLNRSINARWLDEIGFLSARKAAKVDVNDSQHSGVHDSGNPDFDHLPGFYLDRIASAELGDEELTYDLSVPVNVTYVANGFVSHNTIGLMMDCDTTGIEPDLGLVKMKKLVGGGTMSIVNQTIPRALRRLGYSSAQIDEVVAYIDTEKSIVGAPHLDPAHLAVFACSMGDNTIHYEGHVRMMGAVQPLLSGSISKTVNMPEEVTVEDVEGLHQLAWELGLKAVAIYRDNCKVGQPLSTAKKDDAAAEATTIVEKVVEKVVHRPLRQKLPRSRRGRTFEFRVADCKGFATIGEYDDGRPGEIFLTVSKQGSTLSGIMDAFAKSISYGLQYGVPLRAFVEAFTNMRFEPAGMTDDPDIRFATSIMDYLFRRLAIEYLTVEERAELSIFTVDERMQPTLPGVDETVIETSTGSEIAADPKSVPSAGELADQLELGTAAPTPVDNTPAAGVIRDHDAPMCMQCGVTMIRAGSCHACPSCGSTSGCS